MFHSQLPPFTISYQNAEEFHRLKKEIFSQHVYYFETTNPHPVIIDAGAHIGLATLYFKKLFPGAQVQAIEPLPQNHRFLEENIGQNGLSDVQVVPSALWSTAQNLPFYFDQSSFQWFSTASIFPHAWNDQQTLTTSTTVRAIPLSHLLTQPIDFLKMDIEGAEQAVLEEAQSQLSLIKEMMIEFHPGRQQSLANLVNLLQEQGFTTHVWKDDKEVAVNRATGLVYLQAKQNR